MLPAVLGVVPGFRLLHILLSLFLPNSSHLPPSLPFILSHPPIPTPIPNVVPSPHGPNPECCPQPYIPKILHHDHIPIPSIAACARRGSERETTHTFPTPLHEREWLNSGPSRCREGDGDVKYFLKKKTSEAGPRPRWTLTSFGDDNCMCAVSGDTSADELRMRAYWGMSAGQTQEQVTADASHPSSLSNGPCLYCPPTFHFQQLRASLSPLPSSLFPLPSSPSSPPSSLQNREAGKSSDTWPSLSRFLRRRSA